jgi:hypothetical protein
MAMKYLPTVRDQKAAVRYLNKQKQTPNFKKSSDKAASPLKSVAAQSVPASEGTNTSSAIPPIPAVASAPAKLENPASGG